MEPASPQQRSHAALALLISGALGFQLGYIYPPAELRGAGRLLPDVHRGTWQGYTGEDWKRIRRDFHVTQVLTTADWQLDLPIAAGDRRYLLYAIPE